MAIYMSNYQYVSHLLKSKRLIISVFHSVPPVPRAKMERMEHLQS